MSAEVGKATSDEAIVEVIARAAHNNDPAYAPPYWDDCYPEMKRFYRIQGAAVLAALRSAGWDVVHTTNHYVDISANGEGQA